MAEGNESRPKKKPTIKELQSQVDKLRGQLMELAGAHNNLSHITRSVNDNLILAMFELKATTRFLAEVYPEFEQKKQGHFESIRIEEEAKLAELRKEQDGKADGQNSGTSSERSRIIQPGRL